MHYSVKFAVLLILLMFTLTCTKSEQDWAKWRGPNGSGAIAEADWNAHALDKPKILWRADVGKGHSSVIASDKHLFTMGEKVKISENDTTYFEAVYCIDAESGNTKWMYEYESATGRWPGPGASPALSDGRVYTAGRNADVYCFDASDGRIIWNLNLVEKNYSEQPDWLYAGSWLIEGDLAILNSGKSGLALDEKTGDVVWKSEAVKCGLATPVLWNNQGEKLVVINGNETIYAVNVENGEVIWSYPWTSYTDPLFMGNRFFINTWDDGLNLFEVDGVEIKNIWQQKVLTYTWNHFVVVDRHAYGIGRIKGDFYLMCVNMDNGEIKWSEETGMWGSVMAAGDKVIMIDGDGDLKIIQAAAESFQIISESQIWDLGDWRQYPNGAPHTCWTMPTMADGKLYLRTSWGKIACIDLS